MALPVLDGNQSATTLSSVVTGGEHIVAHTVVSLGSTTISNITNAVSGSVVSVSNFPATQTIAGTVTARVDTTSLVDALSAFTNADAPLPISGTVTANPTGTQIIAGTVTANLPALNWNTVKISFAEGSHFDGIYKKGGSGYVNQISGGVPVYLPIDDNFYNEVNPVLTRSTQTGSGVTFSGTRWNFQETLNGEVAFYAATTAADLRLVNEWSDGNGEVSVYITPYSVEPVAITNSVTVGSLPAISGTVTVGNSVTVAGTVTANGGDFAKIPAVETSPPAKAIRIGFGTDENWNGVGRGASGVPLPVAIFGAAGVSDGIGFTNIGGNSYANVNVGNSVTIGSLPSGSLTTRFGSVTTANTAQITSAVTNTSRKYLLAQNISAGTVTIGIGFSPTTTQGIQLTAGGGLTFDAFCPTGAVYWLGAVTGAAFTILEG